MRPPEGSRRCLCLFWIRVALEEESDMPIHKRPERLRKSAGRAVYRGELEGWQGGLGPLLLGFWPPKGQEIKARSFFGQKHDFCRRPSVFFGVMVMEDKAKFRFQIGEPMTPITFEFRPGFPRNGDAVDPFAVQMWDPIGVAGHIKGLFVKGAMLDKDALFQPMAQRAQHFGKGGRARDLSGANTVQLNIEG